MKRMLLVVAVLGSQIFHSASGSDGWFAYAESDTSTFYLNSNSIKESGGFVYYWRMSDKLVPDEYGTLSSQVYSQGDCSRMSVKTLSYIFFKGSKGTGPSDTQQSVNKDWKYPPPGSAALAALQWVCARTAK